MSNVFLILQANIIEQLGVRRQDLGNLDAPRLRVSFRVVDGEPDLERPVVYAPESFGWRTLLLQGAKDDFGENPTGESLVIGGQINRPAFTHYRDSLNSWNKVGAALVAFWLGLLFLLILGFGYSFFFSTSTIIYLLLRRNLDAAEMDEVYLEEEDQEGAYGGPLRTWAKL